MAEYTELLDAMLDKAGIPRDLVRVAEPTYTDLGTRYRMQYFLRGDTHELNFTISKEMLADDPPCESRIIQAALTNAKEALNG